jgi:hypothetical protein
MRRCPAPRRKRQVYGDRRQLKVCYFLYASLDRSRTWRYHPSEMRALEISVSSMHTHSILERDPASRSLSPMPNRALKLQTKQRLWFIQRSVQKIINLALTSGMGTHRGARWPSHTTPKPLPPKLYSDSPTTSGGGVMCRGARFRGWRADR